MRAHIVDLVREIASTPGVRSLSMTTNGVLFSRLAQPLAEAGLQRVNFSLDTLNAQKFTHLTRCGELEEVWNGILAAEAAGLQPIKIYVVVVRDYNEPDVIELARLTLEKNWQVRYIEMMPFGGISEFQQFSSVEPAEIKTSIEAALGALVPLNGGRLDGEARLFRLPDGVGDIGFISTVSQPFCASCTRLRLTADGHLRMCLLREMEVNLLTGADDGFITTRLVVPSEFDNEL